MNPTASLPALHAVLDRWVQPDPEYGGGLSDHLPMALHALWALGAPAGRLAAFAAAHPQARPRPLPPGARVALLRALFADRLARDGHAAVLPNLLPRLLPGVAASAFHGAIRTAHALQAGHAGELAAGLAYWAAAWQPLPEAPACDAPNTTAWLDALWATRPLPPPPGHRITARIAAVAHGDAYHALAGAPAPELPALQRWAAARYAATGNFTLLHLLTASHALGVLLSPGTALPQAVARAVAAAVLASGAATDGTAPQAPPLWPVLLAAARAAHDDHAIKAAHAAWCLCVQHDGALVFRQAAARALSTTLEAASHAVLP